MALRLAFGLVGLRRIGAEGEAHQPYFLPYTHTRSWLCTTHCSSLESGRCLCRNYARFSVSSMLPCLRISRGEAGQIGFTRTDMYHPRVPTPQVGNNRNDSGVVHVRYLSALQPNVRSEAVNYTSIGVLDSRGVQSRYSFLPIVVVFDSREPSTEHQVLWGFGRVSRPLIP